MLGSVYTANSGLLAFSRGLDVVSDNVANLNTPGYKATELQFQDVFYQHLLSGEYQNSFPGAQIGNGGAANLTNVVFSQGDFQETGNETDAAVDGAGFFILREGNETFYTRAGQFEFDDDGYLVARGSDARITGLSSTGELIDITLTGFRSSPPQATSEISFINNLSTGSAQHVIEDVEVYDVLGDSHTLELTFTNNSANTPRSWLIEVRDENDDVIASGGEIRFQGNGSPVEDFNAFTFSFAPEEADASEITLHFGEPDSFSGSTSFSAGANSDLAVESQDGYGIGSLLSTSFDHRGVMQLSYSNGQEEEGARLAMARFENNQALLQIGGGRFIPMEGITGQIGGATELGIGEIKSGTVELSNVELTQQFTDMIIIQRGYQASSQVITVANEMMQQLMGVVQGQR